MKRKLTAIALLLLLSACGDHDNGYYHPKTKDVCAGVDTTSAPDRKEVNGDCITYWWGKCEITGCWGLPDIPPQNGK